tara:strand:- start:473 stop:817 length:345 start_codon:yes stop_codon:yes gene_type:complete
MSNSEIVENIKTWVALNNKIKVLQKELTMMRKDKKNITDKLVEVMKNNDIDEFDLNGGKLIYSKNKVKAPLSRKHLIDSLAKFYKNDTELVEELSKFIMESRSESIKESIKHKD